jgi:carotenoid cleavage dioxygenase-like enzyme
MSTPQNPLLYTTRNEVDVELQIIEGNLPSDIEGAVYLTYPVGSVNSGGLPFPVTDGDYGSPIMNGDGMVLKVKFNGITAQLKTRLMKTPCYYADYHSRNGAPVLDKAFGFSNWGLSRISMLLGMRNLLNTAVIPVQFNESNPSLVATYDVGRPFLLDASSLQLVSPIGANQEWTDGIAMNLPWAFPMVMTTAHPTWDAITKEFFSVNFIRSMSSMLVGERTLFHLKNNGSLFESKLKALIDEIEKNKGVENIVNKVTGFFKNIDEHLGFEKPQISAPQSEAEGKVFLVKWNGEGLMQKWLLHDENGNEILIEQCMHQTGLTEDYIVLSDTSFKFTMDLMFNGLFTNWSWFEKFAREILTSPMEAFTTIFIVKRSDLVSTNSVVTAYKLKQNIPIETIHYSANYANPENQITLYSTHNAALCIAEWMRPYDTEKISGNPVNPDVVSLFCAGSMDLSRFGKWVINAETMSLDEANSTTYHSTGNLEKQNIGPNTWNMCLYTYRDMISPTKMVEEVEYVWFVSNGLDQRMLSEFIFNLYKDYPNRIVEVNDFLNYTKQGIPCGLTRLDTATMKAEDYYQLDMTTYYRSLQFIPRNQPKQGVPYGLDGYIFCSMQVANPPEAPDAFHAEFWLFDASNIAQGPICKMFNDEIIFCFTLHSAWLDNDANYNLPYKLNIKDDYNEVIAKLPFGDREIVQIFFDVNVYPNF